MDRRSWLLLLLLASVWGASYLFIEIALEDFSPGMIVCLRLTLAALVLVPLAVRRDALVGLRPHALALALLALVQVAGPFMLITIGQEEITSSLAGILVASAPIFTAILAVWLDQEERTHGWRLAGIAAGIVGVALLLGVDLGGEGAALVGGLMVVLASLGYAFGAFMVKHRFTGVQPLGLVAAAMAASALLTAPLALASLPDQAPGLGPLAALLVLGVAGTGVAFAIFYWLIAEVGPTRAALVAYVAPGFAVLYGVLLLDERVTIGTFAGLALILSGSWVAGRGGVPRSGAAPVAPEVPPLRGEPVVREAA